MKKSINHSGKLLHLGSILIRVGIKLRYGIYKKCHLTQFANGNFSNGHLPLSDALANSLCCTEMSDISNI